MSMIISGKRIFLTNRHFWRIVVNVVVLTALLYFFQASQASLFSQNYSIKFNWQYADSTDSFSLFYLQDNTWIQESQAPLSSPLSLSDDLLSSNIFVLKFDSKATELSLETVDVFLINKR